MASKVASDYHSTMDTANIKAEWAALKSQLSTLLEWAERGEAPQNDEIKAVRNAVAKFDESLSGSDPHA